MSEMKGKKISLWKFLENNSIEIPIIQRDYAQGRVGKEKLRERFLTDLKKALDSENDNEELLLDFVYGNEDEKRNFQPLDGQQRLTTLWLLHWYIAYKAGKIEKEPDDPGDPEESEESKKIKRRLSKFSYKTRRPAEDFCEGLSEFAIEQKDCNIYRHLKNNVSSICDETDPTVKSMLNMLNGTDNTEIIDGIEKLFESAETTTDDYKNYWKKLTSENAPIAFYILPLKDFNLSDDLYIKMNARGKQLTDFENLKADLIDYIKKQVDDGHSEWSDLLSTEGGSIAIDAKIDTSWTDIFWKHRSNENRIDEIYFAFMNRFFWNELFTAQNQKEEYVLKSLDSEDLKENKSYKQFTSESVYEDLDNYKYFDGEIPLQLFTDLNKVLDNYIYYTKDPNWEIPYTKWIKDFEFIPKYVEKDKKNDVEKDKIIITGITQPQRIVFFALCKYFKEEEENEGANPSALKSWMRVVCNLVSGRDITGQSQVRDESIIREAIAYIDQLKSHDVYNSEWEKIPIKNESAVFNFAGKFKEEKIKAKKIFEEKNKGNNEWEEKLQEVEEYSFFNGTIRFLFQGEDGKEDWDDFDAKWDNVKKYFSKEIIPIDRLKALFSRFNKTDFDMVILNKSYGNKSQLNILSNRDACWHYYLVNPLICRPVHEFLLNGEVQKLPPLSDNFSEHKENDTLYYLSQTNLLDVVVKTIPDARITSYFSVYKYKSQEDSGLFILLKTDKYDYLDDAEVTKETITKENGDEENTAITGTKLHCEFSNIYFKYKGKYYFRQGGKDRYIYLRKDGSYNGESEIKNENEKDAHKRYYCFDPEGKGKNDILKNLEALKEEADSKKK